VDLAMPLSLALAELLANAVKHAFAQGRGGTIALAIRREGGALSVLVADNGVGLPTGFDPSASTGLGMKIVQALVHQQLDGRLEFVDSSHGAAFHITIPMD
jgi:two-component sensor histidine kinase